MNKTFDLKISNLTERLLEIESEILEISMSYEPILDNPKEDYVKSKKHGENLPLLKLEYDKLFVSIIDLDLDVNHMYFEFCSFDHYKNRYTQLLSNFKKHYPDSNEEEFCEDEIIGYTRVIPTKLVNIEENISLKTKAKIEFSQRRKVEFLNKIIKRNDEITSGKEYKNDSEFSVLEWAAIFYYANETNLLPEAREITGKIENFREENNISASAKSLRSKYYIAKKRINKTNDFPIDKLQRIIPFLESNYNQSVSKVENDIFILKEYESEYE
ncbi:hypothetical protein N1F78_11545 [Seonamhaeicola sp. MEBiC1930]|uniref:hypothetical protein n=1 Tax=Seonamhaeicola sp. MEBiC01930 TaxID=2976768 RepID=UPI0032551602